MPNHVSQQVQRNVGPRYTLNNGLSEVDGEVSFAFFERNTTTPANSTLLDGTATTADLAENDVVYVAWLPKGARILFGRLFREALGASVTLSAGIVGSPAAFLAPFDASAAGASELAATYALGAGSVMTADTYLTITIAGATPDAGKVISGFIAYGKN